MRACTIDGCEKKHLATGLCEMHYTRVRRHGHHDIPNPGDVGTLVIPRWLAVKSGLEEDGA